MLKYNFISTLRTQIRNFKTYAVIVTALILILLAGCGGGTNPGGELSSTTEAFDFGEDFEGLEEVARSGELVNTDTIFNSPEDLKIVSFAEETGIDDQGSFSISANDTNEHQSMIIEDNEGTPVLLALYDPETDTTEASIESTAKALLLLNPQLIGASPEDKTTYLNAIENDSTWNELISEMENAYSGNPATALNFEDNPIIFQLIVELMVIGIEARQANSEPVTDIQTAKFIEAGENGPYIDNIESNQVKFLNPKAVWYAAGIYRNDEELSSIYNIHKKDGLLRVDWTWPPKITGDPQETEFFLHDGSYRVGLEKGLDYSNILDFGTDPVARATALNTYEMIMHTLSLIVASLPSPDPSKVMDIILQDTSSLIDLSRQIMMEKYQDAVITAIGILQQHADDIAYLLWTESKENAGHFVSAMGGFLKDILQVYKVMEITNTVGPFIYDMVTAESHIDYSFTIQNGVVVSHEINKAPTVEFTSSPSVGTLDTVFEFNAADTTDDIDDIYDFDFRWSWNEGKDWTDWDSRPITSRRFTETGSFAVLCEVRDSSGAVGQTFHYVNVSGGDETATHIIILQDVLPWDTPAMTDLLSDAGFSEADFGDMTFEIVPSLEMRTVELNPDQDLVIIANDQPQSFYNAYAETQIRFNNFVNNGGSLLWGACDEGWSEGSILEAGINLPGNIDIQYNNCYNNYTTDAESPLISDFPYETYHNFASHEGFINLPLNASVYLEDELGNATLMEYNLGSGWIIISGNTYDHQYVYSSNEFATLLPSLISHFTGIEINGNDEPAMAIARNLLTPSSGNIGQ